MKVKKHKTTGNGAGKNTFTGKKRKEFRKKKRDAKKQHRRDYYSRRSKTGQNKKSAYREPNSSVQHDERKNDSNENFGDSYQNCSVNKKLAKNLKSNNGHTEQNNPSFREKETYQDRIIIRKREEAAAYKKLQESAQETRKQQLLEANELEDKNIRLLEKQLRLNKRKNKSIPKSFAEDGLDYLLDACDSDKMKLVGTLENTLNSDSELEEDVAIATAVSGKLPVQTNKNSNSGKCKDSVNKNYEYNDSSASDRLIESDNESDFSNSDATSNSYNSEGTENNFSADHFDISEEEYADQNEQKTKKQKFVRFIDNDNELVKKKFKNAPKEMKTCLKTKLHQDEQDTSQSCAKTMISNEELDQSGMYVCISKTEESDGSESEENKVSNSDDVWEDIYGRLRDSSGNVVPIASQSLAYVPPALRAQPSNVDEKTKQRLLRLKRQIKGYLNRLTESNLPSIASEMDRLYSNNSRYDMNSTFTMLLMESLVTPILSLERLVMEHVALVACLHSRVGSDVGAYILQNSIKQFDVLFKSNLDVENKELDNVVTIICYLYNFKVAHAILIFDVLHCLAERFGPKDLEMILLMLRSVGYGLRKSDPSKMKTLMVQLQELASSNLQKSNEVRVKFMLEILLAVKNNNMARIPGWDPNPVDNMRKLLRSLFNGNVSPELNISLKDLLEADERGRWWVVGSAWTGQAPDEAKVQHNVQDTDPSFSTEVSDCAQGMRMNTDVRRRIFSSLVSAQDYIEAYQRLTELGLKKGLQVRDIIYVTLECCLQGKVYNKYYTLVLQSLCENNRLFRMTLQCSLWTKFRELKSMTDYQFSNLVKLVQHLLLHHVLTLYVFKVIDMTELEKATVRFLRQVLLGILNNDSKESEEVFLTVAKNTKHKMFCRKLQVFFHQYVLSKMPANNPQQTFLQERLDKIFTLHDL